MDLVGEPTLSTFEQLQVGLMHQRRCLKCVIGTFTGKVTRSDSVQFGVQGRGEFVYRRTVSRTELVEQLWYGTVHETQITIARMALHDYSLLAVIGPDSSNRSTPAGFRYQDPSEVSV